MWGIDLVALVVEWLSLLQDLVLQVQQVLMLLLLLVVQLLLSRGRQLDEGAIMAPCSSCSAAKGCGGLCGVVVVVFYVSE